MSEIERGHSRDNLIWKGHDHEGKEVRLYTNERDHIISGHDNDVASNFTAVYDTVQTPEAVYAGGNALKAHGPRKVFFKRSELADYYPLYTKAIVEYQKEEYGFIVSAMVTKKEGGNVGEKLYPKQELRPDE